MKSLLAGAALAMLVTGCSTTSLTLPVAGQLDDGTPMLGENDVMAGTFWFSDGGTKRCTGTYDNMDSSSTITAPVRCNDGTKGRATITRSGINAMGMAITALVKFSDGTTGQFVAGPNAVYSQDFGKGSSANVF